MFDNKAEDDKPVFGELYSVLNIEPTITNNSEINEITSAWGTSGLALFYLDATKLMCI